MEFQFSLSITALFIFLIFFLFMKLTKIDRRSKDPPGPAKLPLIGNIHQLVGIQHHLLRDLARKHGPLMHLRLGEISAIVVSSPRVAKEVLKTHDVAFADRPEFIATKIMFEGVDLGFSPYGDYWRQMHKICVKELLSKRNVRSFHSIREEEVRTLVTSLQSSSGSIINLTEQVYSLSSAIIWRAAVGRKNKDQEDLFIRLSREFVSLLGGLDVADLFPSLKFLHPLSRTKPRIIKIHEEISEIVDKIINDQHREARVMEKILAAKKELPVENILGVLLRLQESDTLEFPITSQNMRAVILNLFIAGSDTSSATVDWAMCEMIKNPRVMEKATAEVRLAFKGKKNIQETDIQELPYLSLVIKETWRLHPPAPLLLPKECREACEIDGYTIPLKTLVFVNAWAIGRDPEHWHDPEMFIPERFEGSSVDFIGNDYNYIPFGSGRRMCPGILFGLAVVELTLAQLLYHFNFALPNGMKPEELDMSESSGSVSKKIKDLCVLATPYDTSLHD